MKMHLQGTAGLQVIRSHATGEVTVNSDTFRQTFLLTPDAIVPGSWPASLAELRPCHFEMIVGLNPEIVLLGTGSKLHHPPATIFAPLAAAGIGYEVMDTGAACRTYNILLGEGRQVCVLFLLPGTR